MPSGAKKRKAAKRRKEQEEQQQLGAHPPGSPTSPTAGPPHPPEGGSVHLWFEPPARKSFLWLSNWKGNGVREEEDDLTSQEGKGTESGGEFPSPSARGGYHCTLEVETDEEHAKSRVKAEGKAEGKQESETTVAVDAVNVMENTENGGSEQPTEPLVPQKAEDEVTKTSEVEVPVAVVRVQQDDVSLPPPPLDPIPLTSAEVLISKVEEVSVELQSEKGKEVDVSGVTPPPVQHKQSDDVDTASPVGPSVPIIEEEVPASVVPIESFEVIESAAEAQSSTIQEKVVVLSEAASEQPDLGAKGHPHTETREIAGTTEVVRSTPLQQRTSWLSCCGIFDVITGANR
ncbi:hypothetical protein Taro_040238 [Colocasia esculenta]|uniref:Uncharacterized protein n=1 Tax=Colocasia esculenta TaxID=4460 RepID=A0A843WIK1_COLES|nr:hypothetical protein [Colocasia esculenta]